MAEQSQSAFDLLIVGGGPGGYPAAIRAAQNKLSVACIDGWKNLDGSYAWLGRAEGDWSAIAEGDVILHAKVE